MSISKERFHLLFENSPDAMVIADDQGRYLDVNPAACALFGYSREQMLGMSVADLMTPQDPDAATQYRAYLQTERASSEFVFIRSDGALRVAAYSACRLAPGEHLSILRDITAQKQSEESRRREQEFNETALNSLPGIFYVIDENGRFLRWNHNLERVSGYSAEEIAALHPTDFFDDADKPMISERMADVFQKGTATAEAPLVAKNGTRTPYFFTGSRTRLNEKICLVGMGIDISERKRLDRQLHEETETLETIHRLGQRLSAELDLETLVQAATDAATQLTGARFGAFFYNVVNPAGESYMLYTLSGVSREAFAQFPMPRNTAVFAPTFAGEAPVRLDDVTKDPRYGKNPPYYGKPPGHLPVVSYLAVSVVSRSGEVLGGLFFGHEQVGKFTERHERIVEGLAAQAAIAIDNARLFQAERERSEQLALAISEVHHRVKNNLQSVGALLEMQIPVEGDSVPVEAVRDSLSQIKTIALVHDLLTRDKPIGLVDAGQVLTNLGRLLSSGMSAGRQQVRITVVAEPVQMSTKTATALALAVNELLTNAAKHQRISEEAAEAGSETDRIIVTMRRSEDNITVTVQDSGPGFPPDFAPDLHAHIGLQLVQTLVQHDLHGSVHFGNASNVNAPAYAPGGYVEIVFPASACAEE